MFPSFFGHASRSRILQISVLTLVMNFLGVLYCIIHQCMTGLRAPDGMLLKKPTGFTASHELLVRYLRLLWCIGRVHSLH